MPSACYARYERPPLTFAGAGAEILDPGRPRPNVESDIAGPLEDSGRESCRSRLAARGRVPVAASGCFVDAKRVGPKSGYQAALERRDGQLRVGNVISSSREAVIDATPALVIGQRLLHLLQPSLMNTTLVHPNDCSLPVSVNTASGGQGQQPLRSGHPKLRDKERFQVG